MADEIGRLQKVKGKRISVLSVASGHLRELAYINNAEEKISSFVCLDQDIESNQVVRSTYGDKPFITVIDESISHILKGKMKEERFDFIYSAGLFDYLNDKLASRMIERLYELVEPGGVLMVPNYIAGLKEKVFMDTFMKWNLIYRSREEMQSLADTAVIPQEEREVYVDEHKCIVYLKIQKPAK